MNVLSRPTLSTGHIQNKKQRYSIEFQVSYNTDLHALFDLLREVVASHPQVLRRR